MSLIYRADPDRGLIWKGLLADRAPDLEFRLWPDVGDPKAARYFACWTAPDDLSERFPNLEVVLSTGAGIDQFNLATLPGHIKVVRMLDPWNVAGMVEYVLFSVLALHRDMIDYRNAQSEGRWAPMTIPRADERRIGILGLGEIGSAAARALRDLKFPVAGWSRTPRQIEGITTFSGPQGLEELLKRTDILVCLLPLTRETHGILSARLFSALPKGAGIVSAGRGRQMVATDLLAALDNGHLSGAVLDVTEPEPLPADDPLWRHPRIILTPHIASNPHPSTAVDFVLEVIRDHEAGRPLRGLVDRSRGY